MAYTGALEKASPNLDGLRAEVDRLLATNKGRCGKTAVADYVVGWAVKVNRLGWDASREQAYLIDGDMALPLEGRAAEQALFRLGLSPDEVVGGWLLRALRIEAQEHGIRRPLANWSSRDVATGAIYVSNWPDCVVKAPATELVHNGTDGVWFHPAMTLPPWDATSGLVGALPQALRPVFTIGSWLGYGPDVQAVLLAAWLEAMVAGIRPLPMLSLLGHKGTGKSTFARGVLAMLMGEGQQPIPLPRERRDYEQALTSLPLVALDNVDEVLHGWFADITASVLTGATIRRRRLGTDAGTYQAPAEAAILITSRTGLHLRDDLRDRTLPIFLAAPPFRASDAEMVREVVEQRDALLTTLVEDSAAKSVKMRAVAADVPTRFADFGRFVVAGWGSRGLKALEALEAQQILLDKATRRIYEAASAAPPEPAIGSALVRGTADEIVSRLGKNAGLDASDLRKLDARAVLADLAVLLRLQGWQVDQQDGTGQGIRLIGPMVPRLLPPAPSQFSDLGAGKHY